jgi:hypothetical protein
MKTYFDSTKLYRQMEERKKRYAIQPIFHKLAVIARLRDAQETLAPIRAANKAKRAAGKTEIRIKTA